MTLKKCKSLIKRLYFNDSFRNKKSGTPLEKSWLRYWLASFSSGLDVSKEHSFYLSFIPLTVCNNLYMKNVRVYIYIYTAMSPLAVMYCWERVEYKGIT